jgi:hypothetical protein
MSDVLSGGLWMSFTGVLVQNIYGECIVPRFFTLYGTQMFIIEFIICPR